MSISEKLMLLLQNNHSYSLVFSPSQKWRKNREQTDGRTEERFRQSTFFSKRALITDCGWKKRTIRDVGQSVDFGDKTFEAVKEFVYYCVSSDIEENPDYK
jgi:hypothetical protein